MTIEKYLKIIVILAMALILGLLLTCYRKTTKAEEKTISTVEIKDRIIYIHDTISIPHPIVRYKYKNIIKYLELGGQTKDTIIKDFNPKDYQYSFKKNITNDKESKTDIVIQGWGAIDDFNIIRIDKIIAKDSIKTITNTITKTETVDRGGLFIKGMYSTRKDIGLGLDWSIKNKIIIGANVQYNVITNQPMLGVSVGFKIK